MKIRKLQLKNIGVFDDEIIEFLPCPAKDKAEIHILTGQNGSGKTTVLMALAGIFNYWHGESDNKEIGYGLIEYDDFSSEFSFTNRFRNAESKMEVTFENGHTSKLETRSFHHDFAETKYIGNDEEVENYRVGVVSKYSPKNIKFIVLTYSGYRRINPEYVELSKRFRSNPLNYSLNFGEYVDSEENFTINQWLANVISNRALAREDNDKNDLKKYEYIISTFENSISEIIGTKIKFVLKREPFHIKFKANNEELNFDVLPDGIRSLLSWIGDLLMRIDLLDTDDNLPVFDKKLILLLDEIEVHLHPAWQRKVLPVVQKLFKNSQIFVSTHSPFVVNSVDDAWVYKLELKNGKANVADVIKSEDGISYQTVLSEILGIDEEFGGKTQEDLDEFYNIVRNGKKINEKELLNLAKSLAVQSEELNSIVQIELRQLSRRKGKEFSL